MKKALPNTKVTVKLRRSNYKEEWYLIIESYQFISEVLNEQAVWWNPLTGLYPRLFGTNRPLHVFCQMEHSTISLSVI